MGEFNSDVHCIHYSEHKSFRRNQVAIIVNKRVQNALLLLSHFSRVQLCATPSLGFSRQEHWSGLPFPSPMYKSEKWKWNCSVMSDSSRSHGLQPTRLLRPWDFPDKSTGVGCHCQNELLGCNLKNDRVISVRFQGKPFNIMVIHVTQPVMLKRLKLNNSMKTYNTF